VSTRLSPAIDFLNADRVDLAERLARDELAQDPESWDAHRILAVCLRRRGQLKASLGEAEEALARAPESWLCHLERARTLLEMRRRVEAEREMREAISGAPDNASLHADLATILTDQNRLADAAIAAREGLRLDPHDVACLNALALALLQANRTDDARQVLREALVDEPTRAFLHHNLGAALLEGNQFQSAAAEFREALRLNPGSRDAERDLQLACRLQDNSERLHIPKPYGLRLVRFLFAPSLARRLAILAGLAVLAVIGIFFVLQKLLVGSIPAITLVGALGLALVATVLDSKPFSRGADKPAAGRPVVAGRMTATPAVEGLDRDAPGWRGRDAVPGEDLITRDHDGP
jgi:Tfp pilus assembly protein PilF